MPKPTRAERRRLAEKGKLAPRRPAPVMDRPAAAPVESAPVARTSPRAVRGAASEAAMQPAHEPDAQEYAYVKSDLLRILILAVLLIGGMIGLRLVLPQ
jgi:hypothetical protein